MRLGGVFGIFAFAVEGIFRIHHRKREDPEYRSEEHTSELQSQSNLVCRLLLEKKKTQVHVSAESVDTAHLSHHCSVHYPRMPCRLLTRPLFLTPVTATARISPRTCTDNPATS